MACADSSTPFRMIATNAPIATVAAVTAVMIAKKRGADPELAAMAGLLHDLYAYKSGSYDDHAHKGAELARTILKELNLTDESETE